MQKLHVVRETVTRAEDADCLGEWELRYSSGESVLRGDKVTSPRGKIDYMITGGKPPHKLFSSGRVFVVTDDLEAQDNEYFPSVFDMKWHKL